MKIPFPPISNTKTPFPSISNTKTPFPSICNTKIPFPPISNAIDISRQMIKTLHSIDQKDESVQLQLEYLYTVTEALERHFPRPPMEWYFNGAYWGCPTCCEPVDLNNIIYREQHCQCCGQVIDMEDFFYEH